MGPSAIAILEPKDVTVNNIALMLSQVEKIPSIPEDKTQYETVKGMHIQVKKILPKIEARRVKIKAGPLEVCRRIDKSAKEAVSLVQPLISATGSRREAWENIEEKAKAEKMAAEKARTDAILSEITHIEDIAAAAQAYGLSSDEIQKHIAILESLPVEESQFQEFTENTIALKAKSLEIVRACLDRTLKFEADQKAQAEIEAANKAEADRLAKIAAEQEKAIKIAEAERAIVEAKIKAERDAEAANIAADRKALEDAKAAIQAERDQMAAETEKAAFAERVRWCESIGAEWFVADFNEAHNINKEIDNQRLIEKLKAWAEAIEINDQINLGQSMADDVEAARLEALKPDKEKLLALSEAIKAIKMPELNTDQARGYARWAIKALDCTAKDLEGMISGL